MEDNKKIEALCKLWVEWNRHEISGEDFASKFHKLFKKETLAEWNNPLRKLLLGEEYCPHRDNDFPCPDHVPDELRLRKRDCPDCMEFAQGYIKSTKDSMTDKPSLCSRDIPEICAECSTFEKCEGSNIEDCQQRKPSTANREAVEKILRETIIAVTGKFCRGYIIASSRDNLRDQILALSPPMEVPKQTRSKYGYKHYDAGGDRR